MLIIFAIPLIGFVFIAALSCSDWLRGRDY